MNNMFDNIYNNLNFIEISNLLEKASMLCGADNNKQRSFEIVNKVALLKLFQEDAKYSNELEYIINLKKEKHEYGEAEYTVNAACNYYDAYVNFINGNQSNISTKDIKDLYQVLFKKRSVDKTGDYIDFNNKEFDELINYINRKDNHSLLIKLAIVFFRFQQIFENKNGNIRMGCVLVSLLYSRFRNDKHATCLLGKTYRNSLTYYFAAVNNSKNGNWNYCIKYFLTCIIDKAQEEAQIWNNEYTKYLFYYENNNTGLAKEKYIQLVDIAYTNLIVISEDVEKKLNVSNVTANTYLRKMVECGILQRLDAKARKRAYLSNMF